MTDVEAQARAGMTRSLFGAVQAQPADSLLALIALHGADPRPGKIDLGVGVYRDETGATPVLRAVKAAEARLLADQQTKSYLGSEGDVGFTERLSTIVFGASLAASDRLTGVQTPGGTGALRLGAELLARASPGSRIWIGTPTWPNHGPIFREAGLAVENHAYFDVRTSELDFDAMIAALAMARPGDVVLLHGCCHNPTGTGFSLDQWHVLCGFLTSNGLIPFVDLAYQGLGNGLEEDAAGTRILLEALPEAIVAYGCDKNFGLYRERVGALWVLAASAAAVSPVRDNMLTLTRSLWSMPPDHGAAIVRIVLDDPALSDIWRAELDAMRLRIGTLREALAAAHPTLAPIARQRGLFAMLPIDTAAVTALRERHGIYMAASGRINVAGLKDETIAPFVAALAPFLPA